MHKISIDEALLQMIHRSGDAAALAGICHTYTLLIPDEIWDDVCDEMDLTDDEYSRMVDFYRVTKVTVNEYLYLKLEIRYWSAIASRKNLTKLLEDRAGKYIVYSDFAENGGDVSKPDCTAYTALE